MTKGDDTSTFVWTWLQMDTEPVPAGQLIQKGGRFQFRYLEDYLAREEGAFSLYGPELPRRPGLQPLPENLSMPGIIRDGAPDAWGRRVMEAAGIIESEIDFLRLSGSNRIGALDFQASATEYVPREAQDVSIEDLLEEACRVDLRGDISANSPLIPKVAVGGARPKLLVEHRGQSFIAKLPRYREQREVVNIEFAAMRLAYLCGLNVAATFLEKFAGLDVLLVQRFDRHEMPSGKTLRRPVVSGLTMLGLDEMEARYASYEDLALVIRQQAVRPQGELRELFGRVCFNVLIGNTDDHARNHAVNWMGSDMWLTPAYDICPQMRAGRTASQAMMISGDDRSSRLATCLAAAGSFLLDRQEAAGIMISQIETIGARWAEVCEAARLTRLDRRQLTEGAVLNEYCLEGLGKQDRAIVIAFRLAKNEIRKAAVGR